MNSIVTWEYQMYKKDDFYTSALAKKARVFMIMKSS